MAHKNYKISVTVPEVHADKLRRAIAEAGAGLSNKYSHASFSVKGLGRFKPLDGANPNIGQIDRLEKVIEEKIETVCSEEKLKTVIKAIKENHPYEEPVVDVIELVNYE